MLVKQGGSVQFGCAKCKPSETVSDSEAQFFSMTAVKTPVTQIPQTP